jgi:hypothetical protein
MDRDSAAARAALAPAEPSQTTSAGDCLSPPAA